MKAALAALLVVAACMKPAAGPTRLNNTPGGSEPTGGFQLPQSFAKVGDKEDKREELRFDMKVEAQPGRIVSIVTEKQSRTLREALAVDRKGMITKAKFTYVMLSHTETVLGATNEKPSPVTGKSYIVWREGDELHVTAEDGSMPTADELDLVFDDQRNFGTPDPIEKVMTARTFTIGVPVSLTAEELALISAPRAARNFDDYNREQFLGITVTLRKVDDELAHFDLSMKVAVTNAKGNLTMNLDGRLRINKRTGGSGELSGSGVMEGNLGVPVTGTFSTRTWTRD